MNGWYYAYLYYAELFSAFYSVSDSRLDSDPDLDSDFRASAFFVTGIYRTASRWIMNTILAHTNLFQLSKHKFIFV